MKVELLDEVLKLLPFPAEPSIKLHQQHDNTSNRRPAHFFYTVSFISINIMTKPLTKRKSTGSPPIQSHTPCVTSHLLISP